MKSRLLKALGLLFVAGIILVCGFVWYLKATMDEQNTVVDAKGHKVTIDVPGSISQSVEWMRNDWLSVGDEVQIAVYNSVTPVYRACNAEDLKKEIGSVDCSIVLSDRCSPRVRFVKFVERGGESAVEGATLRDVLFKVRSRFGADFLKSTCNGSALQAWTTTAPSQPEPLPASTVASVEVNQPKFHPNPLLSTGTSLSRSPQPHEILQNCKLVPSVPIIVAALDGNDMNELSLHDCGGNTLFVTVSQNQGTRVCSLDFTLGNADGFKIEREASKAIISTSYLPGSDGISSPWIVEVTQRNGSISATSRDGGDPKVQCEN